MKTSLDQENAKQRAHELDRMDRQKSAETAQIYVELAFNVLERRISKAEDASTEDAEKLRNDPLRRYAVSLMKEFSPEGVEFSEELEIALVHHGLPYRYSHEYSSYDYRYPSYDYSSYDTIRPSTPSEPKANSSDEQETPERGESADEDPHP